MIRSSYLRKIEILYNRVAGRMRDQYKIIDMPLGRRASLYIAAHSSENLTSEKVAKALGASEPAMNHALLVVTGMNFNQYLSRLRLVLATTYFLSVRQPAF